MNLPVDWGKYLGGGDATTGARGMTGTTQEGWDQALNWARAFDSNAAIRANEDGTEGQYISFNRALAPMNQMGGRGIENATNLDGLADAKRYTGPVAQDSNLGNIGYSPLAQRQLTDRGTWLNIVGPLVVGGLAGFASGGLGALGNAMTKAPSFLNNLSSSLGGGNTMTPQQMLILRLLALRGKSGG